METRRQITEEDIRRTEALIGRSYGRLKKAAARAPSRAFGSVRGMAREHPLGTAAGAVVGGIALYGLFRLVTRPRARSSREPGHGPDLAMDLLRMAVPLVTPYIAGYLEKYMGRMLSGDRQ
jgi:hypothetical protein